MSSINLPCFPCLSGLYINEPLCMNIFQSDKKMHTKFFFFAIASDDGFIFVQSTYKVKSFLFTAWERKINANDKFGH